MNIDILYHKIKLLLLEYEDILKLDKDYMEIFLKEINTHLNLKNENFTNNQNENIFNEIGEKEIKNKKHGILCVELYRKLSKKLHPDINKKSSDEFIKMSKAYEKNDYITLFLLSYENKIKKILNNDEINLINESITKKEQEINTIKTGLHWKWVLCNNDLEKESIKQHILNNN